MPRIQPADPDRSARRLVIRGLVQGLGVRPAIVCAAHDFGVVGHVRNTPAGVEIFVEGPAAKVAAFSAGFRDALPAGVEIDKFFEETAQPEGCEAFSIEQDDDDQPLTVRVPPDRAMCTKCREETLDAHDRRWRYPFTSCTLCGPRYSILRKLPYERRDTRMAEFPLCDACDAEYTSRASRRFHAQTNACGDCGPQVWAVAPGGGARGAGEQALQFALATLRAGQIVALKGIGGYQLLVDATDERAVRRLRERKHRADKPLAIMTASVDDAARLARLCGAERAALDSPANPIVLVRVSGDGTLAPSVHPGLDSVGVMAPTTPLHQLIANDFGRPLVCTSGNDDGAPLCFEVSEAERQLAGVCDAWVHHDRDIERPIDDSVVRIIAGRQVAIRMVRGLAPLTLNLPVGASALALGGHLKGAAAWSNGRQAVLGPHVGDFECLSSRRRYVEQLSAWQELYRFAPTRLVHDLHPEYFTSAWAGEQALAQLAVQHHHAHVVAGMLEHDWLDQTVLGVSWDGVGYGTDHTVWGGEFLIATARTYRRFARLRPFPLPGGDRCAHEPWRTALALIAETCGEQSVREEFGRFVGTRPIGDAEAILRILDSRRFSPLTSSAGRLCDAASHIALGIERSSYEGQAPMLLEAAADRDERGSYPLPLVAESKHGEEFWELDWRPLIRAMLNDRKAGVAPGAMAMRFHRALAAGIVEVSRRRERLPIVLAGGVFQNRLLTELVVELLDTRQPLGLPGLIPPGDGGLAAGQLAVAAATPIEEDA